MHRSHAEYIPYADKFNLCPAATWQMHRKQSENMHCASIASNLSTCTALARLVPFGGFLTGASQAYRNMIYAGKFNLFLAAFVQIHGKQFEYMHCAGKDSPFQTSWQSHCKLFEYMHCAGKVSSFQRLPGRCMASISRT
jgi:hypothetical protein